MPKLKIPAAEMVKAARARIEEVETPDAIAMAILSGSATIATVMPASRSDVNNVQL